MTNEIHLHVDSELAKEEIPNSKSHNFATAFKTPLVLDKRKYYKAALNKSLTMSYSWYIILNQVMETILLSGR